MHICTVIKVKVQSLQTEQNKYVFKRDLADDSDGAHLTSFRIHFQTEEAKENERPPSVALLCAGLLRRGMLRHLAYIRRFLTSTATATLVSAFVLSRIDYCNSLLFGSTLDVTSHLQRIQNYAARVILRLPMSSRITIHLKSLHWLPVKVRSTYKIACLCYHCHSSTAPSYVTDMLHKKPLHTRNTRSSSYTMPLLNRPAHSKATLGDRSFSFASSSVWNSIPNDVKCAPSLSSFKSRLKTYLFRSVYKD